MTQDIPNLLEKIAQGVTPPDPQVVRQFARRRSRTRSTLRSTGLAIAACLLVGGSALLIMQHEPTELVTNPTTDEGTDNQASADSTSDQSLRQILIAGHRWIVLSRSGIDEAQNGSHEELIFLDSPDRLIVSNCELSAHQVEWEGNGFVLGAETPTGTQTSGISCPKSPGGILRISEDQGSLISIEVNEIEQTLLLQSDRWSLLIRARIPFDVVASPQAEPELDLLRFLAPLERGRWKLIDGDINYPDRDEPDQGIQFWTLRDPGDRMILYGRSCLVTEVSLQWINPGAAVVTEDRSNIEIIAPEVVCDPVAGIANQPPAIGSRISVEGDDDLINVSVISPEGEAVWAARFEYDQFHLVEDSEN